MELDLTGYEFVLDSVTTPGGCAAGIDPGEFTLAFFQCAFDEANAILASTIILDTPGVSNVCFSQSFFAACGAINRFGTPTFACRLDIRRIGRDLHIDLKGPLRLSCEDSGLVETIASIHLKFANCETDCAGEVHLGWVDNFISSSYVASHVTVGSDAMLTPA